MYTVSVINKYLGLLQGATNKTCSDTRMHYPQCKILTSEYLGRADVILLAVMAAIAITTLSVVIAELVATFRKRDYARKLAITAMAIMITNQLAVLVMYAMLMYDKFSYNTPFGPRVTDAIITVIGSLLATIVLIVAIEWIRIVTIIREPNNRTTPIRYLATITFLVIGIPANITTGVISDLVPKSIKPILLVANAIIGFLILTIVISLVGYSGISTLWWLLRQQAGHTYHEAIIRTKAILICLLMLLLTAILISTRIFIPPGGEYPVARMIIILISRILREIGIVSALLVVARYTPQLFFSDWDLPIVGDEDSSFTIAESTTETWDIPSTTETIVVDRTPEPDSLSTESPTLS